MPRRPNPLDPSASPLHYWGSELRFHRERAGLSLDQLGAQTNYTGSYIGAVERAKEMPLRKFAVAMDEALGLGGTLTRAWDALLQPTIYPSWFDWPQYEKEAKILRSFQLALVDGLLQTEAYASALLYGDVGAVAGRLARQGILCRTEQPPPFLVCVLDEAVLHREVGDPDVMRAQLEHLVAVASERVNIHVIRSRQHRGVNGSFVVATLPDRTEVTYLETAARGISTGEPRDLTTTTERFESIRSMAYPVEQSLEIIDRTAKERWS